MNAGLKLELFGRVRAETIGPKTSGMICAALIGCILTLTNAAEERPALVYDSSKSSVYLDHILRGGTASPATELRRELSALIDEVLDGPWLPLYSDYSAAEAGGVGPAEWCFNRPGDYLLALAEAAPYLPEAQKLRARAFLQGLIRTCPPTRQVYLATKEGKARNVRKTPPPAWPSLGGPETQRSLFTEAYAVWAYAQAFDAWEEVKPLFEDLQKLREPLEQQGDFWPHYRAGQADLLTATDLKDPEYCFNIYQSLLAGDQDNYGYHGARAARQRLEKNQPIFLYIKQLAALTGYYRLAQHWQQAEEVQWARRTFSQIAVITVSHKSAPYLWSDPSLCPEIGRLIRDMAGSWLDELAWTPNVGNLPATDWNQQRVAGRRDHFVMNPYTWYHAWGGQGEGVRPRTVMGAFLVNAYLFKAPADKIAGTLDIPWCKADLFYDRKLVAAIQAMERAEWVRVY